MRWTAALLLAALALAVPLSVSPAYGQPELVEVDPPDGSASELPPIVRLCFSEEISGRFQMTWTLPDGTEAGTRAAFDPNGECLDTEAVPPEGATGGEYTLDWQVQAATGGDQATGTLTYSVGEEGEPLPLASPTAAPTAEPTPGATGTPTPEGTATATATPEPGATATATPTPAAGEPGDDDQDILTIALITIGVGGGAAALGLVLYLVRRRIGFDWHKPPEDGEGGPGH